MNPNLRLPSGTAKAWGNLEYDVNLMLAEKAWDADGQLAMDIFDFDMRPETKPVKLDMGSCAFTSDKK